MIPSSKITQKHLIRSHVHRRLLTKIRSLGIKGYVAEWITDFLSGRRQRVSVNDCFSDWASVTSGIPQWSVLGPVLFLLIFINDLPEVVDNIVRMFADDTKIYCSIPGPNSDAPITLQQDVDKLLKWTDTWQLRFNTLKCKVMHTGRKNPNVERGRIPHTRKHQKKERLGSYTRPTAHL